jgi:hypothetical protein
MLGFDDTLNPVNLLCDDFGLGVGPFQLSGGATTVATTYGLITTVAGTRYLIPWTHVRAVTQVQPAVVVPPPPN